MTLSYSDAPLSSESSLVFVIRYHLFHFLTWVRSLVPSPLSAAPLSVFSCEFSFTACLDALFFLHVLPSFPRTCASFFCVPGAVLFNRETLPRLPDRAETPALPLTRFLSHFLLVTSLSPSPLTWSFCHRREEPFSSLRMVTSFSAIPSRIKVKLFTRLCQDLPASP